MKKYLLIFILSILYSGVLTVLSSPDLMNDSGQYFSYGQNLIKTGIYGIQTGVPDTHREPGYGFFIGLVMKLFNSESLHFIIFMQAFLFFWAVWFFSFKSFLKSGLSKIYFYLALLSPTLAGTATVIYSEVLSIILILVYLYSLWLFVQPTKSKKKYYIYLSVLFLSFGALILTKSYLQYIAVIFIPLAFYFYKNKKTKIALALVLSILSGILVNFAWNQRNIAMMGENYSQYRVPSVIVGRVARVNKISLPKDILPAIVAAVGTNLCYRIYGEDRCLYLEIRGADSLSAEIIRDYYNKYPNSKGLAEKQAIRDYLPQFFKQPFKQFFASIVETIRMSFFEAPQKSKTIPFLNTLGAAWHFGGSLLFLFLFIRGLKGKKTDYELIMISIIFYHWLFMAQMTNLVRYVYPVLPLIYFFVAKGILAVAKAPPIKSHIKKQL